MVKKRQSGEAKNTVYFGLDEIRAWPPMSSPLQYAKKYPIG